MFSSAAFQGVAASTGTGVEALQAAAPTLSLDYPAFVEGVGNPVLKWRDDTPTATASWAIFRQLRTEGGSSSPWSQVMWIGTPATATWTDISVPLGSTATYAVQAILTDGTVGPTSNAVISGRRPAGTTVTVTGQPTALKVDWPPATGATSYDVYRDDDLLANLGNVTSYTDATGYGHAHTYRVVPVNRWEQKWTTGDEAGRLDPADAAQVASRAYTGGVTRLTSPAQGGFTAPAAPSITAVPTTSWTTVVTRTYAGWVGAGPTTLAGVSRDRGWVTERAALSGGFAALWGEATSASQTHGSRTPGATDRYRAQACNASGCSPTSSIASALQRPPVPSCTTSGATTRSMNVSISRPVIESAYTGSRVSGGAGAPIGGGVIAGTSWGIDQLTHSTTQTWTVASQNGSPANGGWSDSATCSGATLPLAVAITGTSSTTRTVNASMSTTNGSASNLTLEGVRTDWNVASASWDPLTHDRDWQVTARNGDGYNEVVATAAIRTQQLTVVGPTAGISGGGTDPSGYATVTATGGTGTKQVKLGSSGGVWTSSSQYFSGLGTGSYYGYARSYASDGFNSVYSGWDSAGPISVAFAPSPWGSTAPGCPSIGVYVSPGSAIAWEVRRATATGCGARWIVTEAGGTMEAPAGTVKGTGSYTIGSGATSYSGTAGYVWGPLVW